MLLCSEIWRLNKLLYWTVKLYTKTLHHEFGLNQPCFGQTNVVSTCMCVQSSFIFVTVGFGLESILGIKIWRITLPSIAIHQKLADSENIRVWAYEKGPRIIRLNPQSNSYIFDKSDNYWSRRVESTQVHVTGSHYSLVRPLKDATYIYIKKIL